MGIRAIRNKVYAVSRLFWFDEWWSTLLDATSYIGTYLGIDSRG